MRKSSDVLLLGVTNTILVLRFIKSNTFYYFKTAEVVNSKDVIKKSSPAAGRTRRWLGNTSTCPYYGFDM